MWVPKLHGARVGNPRKGGIGWASPIGRQDGLPHDKNPNTGIQISLENLFDRGGPPQTNRSSRRKEKN